MNIHISFVPETLFEIGGFAISNSLFTAIVGTILFLLIALIIRLKLNKYNPGKLELFAEMIYSSLKAMSDSILGAKASKTFIAFLMTFFVMIIFSNWLPLLPGVSSLGLVKIEEHEVTETTLNNEVSNENLIMPRNLNLKKRTKGYLAL